MKVCYIAVLFLLLSIGLIAQKTAVLQRSDQTFKKVQRGADFPLIDSTVVSPEIKFVATIRAKMKRSVSAPSDLFDMKFKIEFQAEDLGANSFRVIDYVINDSSSEVSLTLNTFRCPDSVLNRNKTVTSTNRLYVFYDARYSNRSFPLKINNKEISLGYREYFTYRVGAGEIALVQKGQASAGIKGGDGRSSIALFYTGFDLSLRDVWTFNELPSEDIEFYIRTFFKYPKTINLRQ